ncbi:hypothetical protein [Leptospira meyeri]|uniref:hypothetical protein n=1 Tax=Leptospira meyeri TaxID=29508 RepID=UPI000C2AF1E0|nr:hypothetical protein [Leptospira meyeri]PJZ82967.1 hypothetical protein CH359_02455 [Leptospira meyeri]PJZ98716.1 hypothetical protein CH358_02915 [Leptospira meyeri]PKA12642.1 hypothetical protein CH372_08170 [Leptospira meyeri]
MVRKLLILTLFCSCRLFTIADPSYVERALQNESDEGFISREFFQIKVEIPVTYKEVSGVARRNDCKQRAFVERERLALPYLIQIQRQKHQFGESIDDYSKSLEGKDRQARLIANAPQTTTAIGAVSPTATTTNQQPSAQQGQTATNITQTQKENTIENTHSFSWFFDGLVLYKEDYSDRTKCAFLFRNIQPKLMERVEKTPLLEPRKL